MKIKFADTNLANDGEFPKSLSLETRRRSQTEYTIDADEAKIFDRGNTKTTLAFEIERAHGSEADAEKFAVGHASEIAALSPAALVFEYADGSKTTFENAVVSKIKTEYEKLVSNTRYEFSAGKPKEQQ